MATRAWHSPPPAVEVKRRNQKENRMVGLDVVAKELEREVREELALLNGYR